MHTMFDQYENAKIYYHPLADRLFIFHQATFMMFPCLEREDGMKMICKDPIDECLIYIGEF